MSDSYLLCLYVPYVSLLIWSQRFSFLSSLGHCDSWSRVCLWKWWCCVCFSRSVDCSNTLEVELTYDIIYIILWFLGTLAAMLIKSLSTYLTSHQWHTGFPFTNIALLFLVCRLLDNDLFGFLLVILPCSLSFQFTDNRANEAHFQRLLSKHWLSIYLLMFPSLHVVCTRLFVCWHAIPGHFLRVSSIQSLSRVQLFVTPWIAVLQASLSITNSQSLLRLTFMESVMPSSHLILCRSLLLLPPIPPSIRVFSNESTLCVWWPKYWSFNFSIIPSKEIPGLIFRMDWLDLLAVQGTLKSLLQQHSSKASILQCSAFFTVQLPHPYTTTGKTIALTRWTFVSKVMSLYAI